MEKYFAKKLLPAVTLDHVDPVLKLVETYLESGLDVMEITFRTTGAAEAIESVAKEFPEFKIGAGTLLSPEQVAEAKDAGARFGLSPGLNPRVLDAAKAHDLPFIPGVLSPSDIEKALEYNLNTLKFFPAVPSGGVAMLKALIAPYKHLGINFIPMGGIGIDNMNSFLSLEQVLAVGGSFLAPGDLIKKEKFDEIRRIVEKAAV